ncbi:MAG: amidohydrolase family protein [Micrococcales bacterium]|nr:amidohydrolase family protein [Micrococcales bacterium]
MSAALPDRFPHDPTTLWALTGAVVTPTAVLEPGAIVLQGQTILWVGKPSEAPDAFRPAIAAATTAPLILPGLVDIHCHGGGGASFPDATTPDEVRQGAREHLAHGTTSLVASTVTQAPETLLSKMALLAGLVEDGALAAIHAEGPFISPKRPGAQNPAFIQIPNPGLIDALAEAARGHLATMTIAPEAHGTAVGNTPEPVERSAIQALANAGVIPSFGHTDCAAEDMDRAIAEARAALAAPAARSARPTITHLYNGMRPFAHRDPGPTMAALAAAARGEAVVELVGDNTHLAPAVVAEVFDIAGADNILLITDAMAAAGMPDGAYSLGSLDVEVKDRVARLAGGTAIAGGTAHVLDVVRMSVLDAKVDLVEAVKSASQTPARVLGMERKIGALKAGMRADVLLVDADLKPQAVIKAGTQVA